MEISTKQRLITEARSVGTRHSIGWLVVLADYLEGKPVRFSEEQVLTNAMGAIRHPASHYTRDDVSIVGGLLNRYRYEQILAQAEEIRLPGVTVAENGRTARQVVDSRDRQLELVGI